MFFVYLSRENYVSVIWIPLWLPVDRAVRFLSISAKRKRTRNANKHWNPVDNTAMQSLPWSKASTAWRCSSFNSSISDNFWRALSIHSTRDAILFSPLHATRAEGNDVITNVISNNRKIRCRYSNYRDVVARSPFNAPPPDCPGELARRLTWQTVMLQCYAQWDMRSAKQGNSIPQCNNLWKSNGTVN